MRGDSPMSSVNVVLVMAYGSLVSLFHGVIGDINPELRVSLELHPVTSTHGSLTLGSLPGVCFAVHLCEKTNYAICYEVSQRPTRPPRSQCSQGNTHTHTIYLRDQRCDYLQRFIVGL